MFPSLVQDIGKVVTEHVPWSEPEYTVLDDPAEAIAYLRALERRATNASESGDRDCYVDIEVDIEKDIAFDHPDRYDLLCVGLGDYRTERAVVIGYNACHDDGVLDAMADALAACSLHAQNGKFDLAGLYPKLGPLELRFDTMLASYALDERTQGVHGLKYLLTEFLGAPDYAAELDKYGASKLGYGVIPKDVLYKYNAYDVVGGMRLKRLQEKRLATKAPEWWGEDKFTAKYDYKTLREFHDYLVEYGSNSLMYLELNGIKIDREYNRELHVLYADRLAPIEERLNEILHRRGYGSINPRSPQQVKAALAHLRVRVDSTAEGTLHTILDRVADKEGWEDLTEFCETLLEHRREQKLFSTYVKGPAKRLYKGRVYSTFSMVASISRLASKNPNLQNIVRENHIKKQYIPGKPENLFVQADYAQAELRMTTWMSGCEFFRDLLNDDERDFFDELTPLLYPGKTLDLVGSAISKDAWKELRIRVKAFVYGLNYGRTEFSIASEFKMPKTEAVKVKNNFFNVIPEIVEWQAWVQNHVREGKDLITPMGRHRRFHLITDENWDDIKKEALAFLPQATSSDVCLRAMARVRRDLRGSGAFIRNIVHDSILVDCPPDMVNDVAMLLDRRMVESAQEVVGDYVKFKTDIEVGPSWGELEKYHVG
jgi:DNA polymerase-1